MSNSPGVAVVAEDDPGTQDLITTVLEQSGFEVVIVGDGDAAIAAVREHQPLLTTLDIGLPGIDGFETARRLREFSQTYLIMITSLDDEVDVVRGFEAGADDYLVKPFRPRELRARADATVRRIRHTASPTAPRAEDEDENEDEDAAAAAPPPNALASVHPMVGPPDAPLLDTEIYLVRPPEQTPEQTRGRTRERTGPIGVQTGPEVLPALTFPAGEGSVTVDDEGMLVLGPLRVASLTARATLRGRALGLSKPECDILVSLMHGGTRVRSRADLVLAVRGSHHITSHFISEADKRSVDVHVASLLAKLEDTGHAGLWIEAVRGVGYRLVAQP